MTTRDFCFWLQGFIELNPHADFTMDANQVRTVRNHLALVFKHDIDPTEPGDPAENQTLHDTGPNGPNAHLYGHLGPGVRC